MSQWEETGAEEESSYISMADMMVGLLLIFIILLTYYVLQSRKTVEEAEAVRRVEQAATAARGLVLDRIRARIDDDRIEFDTATGTIRFSEDVLTFSSGDDTIPQSAEMVLAAMADALAETIPCLAYLEGHNPVGNCEWIEAQFSDLKVNGRRLGPLEQFRGPDSQLIWIDGVYIEGHTDCAQFRGDADGFGNWILGARRAGRTYLHMTAHNSDLGRIFSKNPIGGEMRRDAHRVLGVASYADRRPARDFETGAYPDDPLLSEDFTSACQQQLILERGRASDAPVAQSERNRRIDIRISMGWTTASGTSR